MIDHLVYFRPNPGQEENLSQALREFCRNIQGKVDGLVDISWGLNFNPRSAEYTHGLYSRFTTREALDSYQVHPVHLELVGKLNEQFSDHRLPLDFEVEK